MAGESTKINKELILRERLALQRTRLANHTTLLSFIRTSLYFIVAGLTIRSLLKLENGLLFEILFFITAVIIFIIGVFNYFRHTLKVASRGVHRITVDCFEEIDAAVVQFAFTPDPGLAPWVTVLSWTLEIAGKTNWVTLPQGSLDAKGAMVRFVGAQHGLTSVHSACRNSSDPGLAAGFHIARLKAVLSGGEALEPAETEFTIDCGGGCGCGASSPGVFALLALGWAVTARRRGTARR